MTATQPTSLLSRAAVSAEPLAPWCGVAASVTLAVVDLLLAVITPEYDAISETISEMHSVDMAYSTIARLSLLAYCALIVPFTIRASLHAGSEQPLGPGTWPLGCGCTSSWA